MFATASLTIAFAASLPQSTREAIYPPASSVTTTRTLECTTPRRIGVATTADEIFASRNRAEEESRSAGAPPWVGVYETRHEAHVDIVSLGSADGVTLEQSDWLCGQTSRLTHGIIVDARADRVTVQFALDALIGLDGCPRYCGVSTQTYFVARSGMKSYLVPSNAMVEFCDAVNSGESLVGFASRISNSLEGCFVIANGEHGVVVPREYRELLLPEPLVGRVTAHELDTRRLGTSGPQRTIHVTVDLGRRDGLLTGTHVWARYCSLPPAGIVLAAGFSESTVEFTFDGNGCEIPVGTTISTRKPAGAER